MLEPLKRERFRELRRSEDQGTLTPEEESELAVMIREIEEAEAECLRPAAERQDHEIERVEARIQALKALAARKEALVARLERVLTEVESERQAIDAELADISQERSSVGAAVRR